MNYPAAELRGISGNKNKSHRLHKLRRYENPCNLWQRNKTEGELRRIGPK